MNKKLISFIKLICIAYLIFVLPQTISQNSKTPTKKESNRQTLLGLENLITHQNEFKWIKNLNLALISNRLNKKNMDGKRNIELLLKAGFKIKKVFITTQTQNNKQAINQEATLIIDKKNKIPILRWNINTSLIDKNHLADIDAIIIDTVSTGLTHDTATTSIIKTLQTAKQNNKKVIVLDTPNPLGTCMEGCGEIPLRSGMTPGELAIYLNRNSLKKTVNLSVIPMVNWKRDRPFTGLTNRNSLHLFSSLNSCYGYSFLSLLKEIQPLTVETNKQDMFQALLLPQTQDLSSWEIEYLKKTCHNLGLTCRSYTYWNEINQKQFKGIKIRVKKDINRFSAFNSFITLIRFLKNRKNIKLCYSEKLNTMLGSTDIKAFFQDLISFDDLKNKIDFNLAKFYSKSKNCFLYKPFPKINKVQLIKS